ncbi:MAG: DUF262 domain-containing protein [Candidatus Cloacimonetes bacterium]|nr:DUF262 domain-containing protein [Candidatus Cloacimonadota bacterium]
MEDDQEENEDYNEVPPEDIVAYNELRSCADLLRMFEDEQLIIQPDFQRDIVWGNAMQTRLIDSLIKQLPIPSLCISYDYNTQKRYVIDGLQRIYSIVRFLSVDSGHNKTEPWILARLDDISETISGKSNLVIKGTVKKIV